MLESVLTLKGPGLNSLEDRVVLPHLRMPPIDWMPNSFINALAVECAEARTLEKMLESMAFITLLRSHVSRSDKRDKRWHRLRRQQYRFHHSHKQGHAG